MARMIEEFGLPGTDSTHVSLMYNRRSDRLELTVTGQRRVEGERSRLWVTGNLSWHENIPGAEIPVLATIDREDVQDLFELLWRQGFRPRMQTVSASRAVAEALREFLDYEHHNGRTIEDAIPLTFGDLKKWVQVFQHD